MDTRLLAIVILVILYAFVVGLYAGIKVAESKYNEKYMDGYKSGSHTGYQAGYIHGVAECKAGLSLTKTIADENGTVVRYSGSGNSNWTVPKGVLG